jgi:osmotically-inducible protein OsmY
MADALFLGMRANKIRIGVAVVAAVVLLTIPVMAQQPATRDLTQRFVTSGVAVEDLRAVEVGGIVVLRGRTPDRTAAEKAAAVAQSLGFSRVANLIQVADAPDDARIMRLAERELAVHRGLDGTQIVVDSTNGIVRLSGRVSNEVQKDVAVSLVRNIDGVRAVQIALQR